MSSSFINWIQAGTDLVASQGAAHQFAIADWLLEGEERFGEIAYAKAQEITGYALQTLYDYVATARAFPPDSRIYSSATFNHYRAVAPVADPEKRKQFLLQASSRTVREMRDAVAAQCAPHLTSKAKFEKKVKGDAPITVIVSGFERHVLNDLASLRDVDISVIVRPLIAEYVERSRSEWSNGWPRLKEMKNQKLEARRRKWIKDTSGSIEGLIKEYQEQNEPFPAARDFIRGWEIRTGRKFTPRVFNFAMKHTELAHCCGTRNREAYGLAPVSAREKGNKPRYHYKRITPKQHIGSAASIVPDVLAPMLNGTWQEVTELAKAVKGELVRRRLGHTRYFDEGFRLALRALHKEGKVQIEKGRIRKMEAAA